MKMPRLIKRRKPKGARRYIPKSLGVQAFFSQLGDHDVRYVCLRWHEELPLIQDGEDIDVLVDDADIPFVSQLLSGNKKNGIPVDLYSRSGLSRTDYCSVPYFIIPLADATLRSPSTYKGTFKIPDPVNYFYTMCYHAVYHKGLASGLPGAKGQVPEKKADHDYLATLTNLAEEAALPVPEMNLDALDEVLDAAGYKPPTDTLRKYSRRNPWLRAKISAQFEMRDPVYDGLAVFLVRERAVRYVEEIREMLMIEGFELIDVKHLTNTQMDDAARLLRGGNWTRGPWPLSGGKPKIAITAFDCLPKMKAAEDNPSELCNTRIKSTKEFVRKTILNTLPKRERFNPVHSTDSPQDALDYLNLLDPVLEARALAASKRLAHAMEHEYEVIKRLPNNARRAKVEIIKFEGREAVCKTFRPGALRYLDRELKARKISAGRNNVIPVLAHGRNHFVMPLLTHDEAGFSSLKPLGSDRGFMSAWAIAEASKLIKRFRIEGYELIDFSPQNFILDETGNLRVFDFEFLQRGGCEAGHVRGNYAWHFPPDGFRGDYPRVSRKRNPYNENWFRRTGVPRLLCEHVRSKSVFRCAQSVSFVYLSIANLMEISRKWVKHKAALSARKL